MSAVLQPYQLQQDVNGKNGSDGERQADFRVFFELDLNPPFLQNAAGEDVGGCPDRGEIASDTRSDEHPVTEGKGVYPEHGTYVKANGNHENGIGNVIYE